MITHFKVCCCSFVWYLIVAFTICSIPNFELAGLLSGEAYAAQAPVVSSGVSVNVSRFTGAAKAHIPIVVAPGRSEATTPKLSLTYSSSHGNGWLGMGWTLDTGYVKRGYKSDDHYLVMDGVSQKLIFVQNQDGMREWKVEGSEGTLCKIRSSVKLAYGFYLNENWILDAPDGTRYYYGTSDKSRVVGQMGHLADLGYLYWHLERVVDPTGHSVKNKKVGTFVKDPKLDMHLMVTVAIAAVGIAVIITGIILAVDSAPTEGVSRTLAFIDKVHPVSTTVAASRDFIANVKRK
jgi:hypothetical protein